MSQSGFREITNPVKEADAEFRHSVTVTAPLTQVIQQQSSDIADVDFESMKNLTAGVRSAKNTDFIAEREEILALLNDEGKRYVELASEKGSSSWLSVVPTKQSGFLLNKQEFRDAICLRYGFPIRHTPTYCACGVMNDLNHTLNCKKGGYVSMRHNALRDTEAYLLKECCRDVKVEPVLLPARTVEAQDSSEQRLQLDVSAVGSGAHLSVLSLTFVSLTLFPLLMLAPQQSHYSAGTKRKEA